MKKTMIYTVCAIAMCLAGTLGAEIKVIKDGLPYSEKGFGVRRNIYMSGRLGVRYADIAGIFHVAYQGVKNNDLRGVFYTSNENCTWGRCMVPQVLIDGKRYRLTYSNTIHYPFGFTSECTIAGVKLKHELVLDNNALFRRITVLDNPKNKEVRAILVQMGPGTQRFNLVMGEDKKTIVGSSEEGTVEIGSMNPVTMPLNDRPENVRAHGKKKNHPDIPGFKAVLRTRFNLVETQPSKEHLFYLVFDKKPNEDLSCARVDRVFEKFNKERANDARFKTGDEVLDNAFDSVMQISSVMEVDKIGAFRASPSYWVWGWDAMVHAGVLSMTGRAAEVKRMLTFFRDVADPQVGILHQYDLSFKFDNKEGSTAPGSAIILPAHVQLFYVILLYDYYTITGDKAFLDETLPFVEKLVARAKAKNRPGEVLPRQYGFFPDNPYAVGHDYDDISLINCSIYYQGLCAYTALTGKGAEDCKAVKEAMVKYLWDAKEGFWSDSYDVKAKKLRPHYPVYGMFHVSTFGDTIEPQPWKKTARYMKKHFYMNSFLNMFDVNSESHLADGNQLGAYYPVTDRTYWNVMNRANRIDALGDFRKIVKRHWRVLTYPEGQNSDVVNNDPADYSDELGNKQFFAAKSWLADSLELNLGLKWTMEGLSFHAIGDGNAFAVENLKFRGKSFDVYRKGKGCNAKYVFNGKVLETPFIPYSSLQEKNKLEIECY